MGWFAEAFVEEKPFGWRPLMAADNVTENSGLFFPDVFIS